MSKINVIEELNEIIRNCEKTMSNKPIPIDNLFYTSEDHWNGAMRFAVTAMNYLIKELNLYVQ